MPQLIQLQVPAGTSAFEAAPTGNRYTADINGYVYVQPNDVLSLLADGCIPFSGNLGNNFRNVLDGGDFSINPFQRNIPGLATAGVINTAIAATPTYFADRWFAAGGASSSILMAAVADTSVPGFTTDLKVQRQAANTNTAQINFGQVLESADVYRLQGQNVTFSFWAKAGANFSAANSTLGVQIVSGTGLNQSVATLLASGWTGQTNLPLTANGASVTSQALTTGMVRYSFQATVPLAATQLAVLLNYVPVGTAGSDDSFYVNGLQLEVGANAAPFEHRDVQVELEIAQRYAWVIAEPAANSTIGSGYCTGASAQMFNIATPVQLRTIPTLTTSAGTLKVHTNGAPVATGAITTAATVNSLTINTAATSGATGQGCTLVGGGGSGYIVASADY